MSLSACARGLRGAHDGKGTVMEMSSFMSARIGALVAVLATVLVAVAASGAVAGGAAGAPVVIGFLDQEKGAVAFPDFGGGARAARAYIDGNLNGINGRPLKFVECFTDGSPETSIDCANKFVQAKVVAVLEGLDFGADAALPILKAAGIPLVGHTAFGAAQLVSRNAFFFGAALPAFGAAPLKLMSKTLDVKSVVYMGQDNAVVRAFADSGVVPPAQRLGMKITTLFYNAANPDFTQTVTTALASRPDALFFTAPEPDCTSLVAAIRQLGFKGPVFAGSCTAFISADPQDAEGVYTSNDLWAPSAAASAPKDKAAQLRTFVAQMKKRSPKYVTSGFAQFSFSSTMDIAAVLRHIKGKITPASVTRQLRATRNLPSFMGQPISCDGKQWPGQPSACAGGVIEFRVHAGTRQKFSNGFVYAKELASS
jgi:branched-chain amino acid transport system substrate-binding protein